MKTVLGKKYTVFYDGKYVQVMAGETNLSVFNEWHDPRWTPVAGEMYIATEGVSRYKEGWQSPREDPNDIEEEDWQKVVPVSSIDQTPQASLS